MHLINVTLIRKEHVGAGFTPAFSHKTDFLFEVERGRKARAYIVRFKRY
jgi:hypothetical protein